MDIIEKKQIYKGVSYNMMKKWIGASLLILILALTGCSEEKAKPEEKQKTEQKEKNKVAEDMAKNQAKVIKTMKKNAVTLEPNKLEADSKAYDKKVVKATGTITSEVPEGMGASFEMKIGESKFKVLNFTMDSSMASGSEITIYGSVKNGKDAKSGLPLINATYIE
jgi:PBP1b-binding outer membrane lipoprotein LpoB